MDYIPGHCLVDLALSWALRLFGKTDQEKFVELGWVFHTWILGDSMTIMIACVFLNFDLC